MNENENPENAAHKREIAGVFSRSASTYGQVGPLFFTHFGGRLVELARIPPGARVLDVATGRGAVLFPAAEAVGAHGHVTGIDLSEEMVKETSREIERRKLQNVDVQIMDAEYLTFPDQSFDAVFCSFALFFFPQLDRVLSEMYRVLKSQGRIAVSTWGPRDERSNWLRELVDSYLPSNTPEKEQVANEPSKAEPVFDTPEGLKAVLDAAGFADIEILPESKEFTYTDEHELWATLWSHGARRTLEAIEKKRGKHGLESLQAGVFEQMKVIQQTGKYAELFTALYGFATRSSNRP